MKIEGNCYITNEAIYHLLGGKEAGYKPMNMRHEGQSHWFLKHKSGLILDPTVSQFSKTPDYKKARGRGFLTKNPSRKAKKLMNNLVYKNIW